MKCAYCDVAQQEQSLLYADEFAVAFVKETAAVPGQLTVVPREHFTILELVPEDVFQHCILLANKLGMAVFDAFGCQGTNIFIQNGVSAGQKVPHFSIEVIPRRENDGVNLQWQGKQLLEEEMDSAVLILKDGLESRSSEKKVPVVEENKEPLKEETGKNNYLLKSIRRLP